jgi:hypothetical protein
MLEVNRNESLRWEVVSELAGRPNPSLDQFLIDTYEWTKTPNGSRYGSSSVTRALIKTDTPKIREFFSDRWNRGVEEQRDLVLEIGSTPGPYPQLDWMAPLIKDATNSEVRREAAAVLSRIGTPQAAALLEEWTKSPDAGVGNAATDALEELRRLEGEKDRRLGTAADLIAGQIKPDDLLPMSTPYVWDGKDYVPEEEGTQSKADTETSLVRPPNLEAARSFPVVGILL